MDIASIKESDDCVEKECPKRHPRPCKWFHGVSGCRRENNCDFSHDVLHKLSEMEKVNTIITEVPKYTCISCDHTWKESKFVVKHVIQNMEVFFCLNCDDWVQEKSRVLDKGWSLFDMAGNLNQFV